LNSLRGLAPPLYVYDLEAVEERYRRLVEAFRYSNFEILYACKANSNVEILKFLKGLGAGLDAVLPYEVLLGIRVGFKPEKILFTGSSVSDEEMRFVKELGVLINVDSLSQLKRFGKMCPGSEVSIRINPGFGAGHHEKVVTGGVTKFGAYLNQLGGSLRSTDSEL